MANVVPLEPSPLILFRDKKRTVEPTPTHPKKEDSKRQFDPSSCHPKKGRNGDGKKENIHHPEFPSPLFGKARDGNYAPPRSPLSFHSFYTVATRNLDGSLLLFPLLFA